MSPSPEPGPSARGSSRRRSTRCRSTSVSTTLSEPLEWNNSTLIKGDVTEGVAELKGRQQGPILVAGSATLVHTLLENDLVDELRLMVFPVIIGGGVRPFPESQQRKAFKLTDSRSFDSGVAAHTYEPA